MAKASYSEDKNIQEPAAKLLADELGWRSVYAMDEVHGLPSDPHSTLGRKDRSEVVLVRELDKALARLNPKVSPIKLAQARELLLDADPTKTLLQHNEEKWRLLRDGISLKAPSGRPEEDVHVKVVEFAEGKQDDNDFLVVRELWVKSGPYTKRCDLVGFVNGLPLVFIELKRHDKGLKAAFDENYIDYRGRPDDSHPGTIPQLFHYNALVIVSNGLDARYGGITSSWDHFYRWKRLAEEDADPAPKPDTAPLKPILPILLRGMCSKNRLLDIVENYTLFDHSEEHTAKVIARNHQYLGVNRAIDNLREGGPNVLAGKLGVFWHSRLLIPTPPRGYWAKLKAGRTVPARPALKPYNGNPRHLYRFVAQPVPPTEVNVPVDERLEPVLAFERDPANYIQVPSRGTRWHHLVAATRDGFSAGFKDSRGIPLPRGKGVDIAVSAEQRMRALRVMNTLIKALEKRGFTGFR